MKPKISIIVPVYNVSDFLDRCMNTLINQTYKDIEIILIDDGSTDNSGKKCEEYKDKDERIKVIHKENGGLGYARNTGIENADGEYIIFVDSDDYIELNMVEDLYKNIISNDADVCYCDFKRIKDENIIINKHFSGKQGTYEKDKIKNLVIPDLIGGAPEDKSDDIIGWGVWKSIYKKNIIINNNIRFHSEKEMISEDIIFQLDYLKYVNKASILEESLYNYCINSNTLSTSYRKDRFDKIIFLYKEQLKRIKELDAYSSAKVRTDRLLLANIRMIFMIDIKCLKYNEFMQECKSILNNELVREITKEYPIKKLPFRQKIYGYLIKWKKSRIIYIFTKFYVGLKYN